MNKIKSFKIQPSNQSANETSHLDESQGQMPYESIVSQVVAKIKHEPFLFIIAIVVLLIGSSILATKLGSSDQRFIVYAVLFLAFIAILGYYIQVSLQMRSEVQKRPQEIISNRNQPYDMTTDTPIQAESSTNSSNSKDTSGLSFVPKEKLEQHSKIDEQSSTYKGTKNDTFIFNQKRTSLEQERNTGQKLSLDVNQQPGSGHVVPKSAQKSQLQTQGAISSASPVLLENVRYDTANIRKLLTEAITDEDLGYLCMDHFPEVYEQFSSGMSKLQKLHRLIEYCDKHNKFTYLLGIVKKANPGKFADYENDVAKRKE